MRCRRQSLRHDQYGGTNNYGTVFEITPPLVALQFVPLSQPCRAVDTRPAERWQRSDSRWHTSRNFPISGEGGCATLPNAAVYSMNVTVVPGPTLGYLTIWPAGQAQPLVSTLNSVDGRVKANAAIVPAGDGRSRQHLRHGHNQCDRRRQRLLRATNEFHAGVLSAAAVSGRRHARQHVSPGLGPPLLTGGQPRAFPILNATSCNIPPTGVAAYSLNFTVVPHGIAGLPDGLAHGSDPAHGFHFERRAGAGHRQCRHRGCRHGW